MTTTTHTLLPWQQSQFKRLQALASNQRLPHGWIFSGVAGVGKLQFMQFFGQYLLCKQATANGPCGSCQDCHLFLNGTHPDWLLLQPEEAHKQLKIELIRDAIAFAQQTAQRSGAKVIVLRPAEAMNHNATNALLKMLEEPPAATYLFLLSEQPSLLLATLRSRCQALSFPAPATAEALTWLQQHKVSADDAHSCLALTQGAPLLALELAQQQALQGFNKLVTTLEAVVQAQATPVQASKKCEELGLRTTIDYQLLCIKALVDALQTASEPVLPQLASLWTLCQAQPSVALVRRLHQLLQRLLRDRKTALAVNNANATLMTEALFMEWSQVLSKRSMAS